MKTVIIVTVRISKLMLFLIKYYIFDIVFQTGCLGAHSHSRNVCCGVSDHRHILRSLFLFLDVLAGISRVLGLARVYWATYIDNAQRRTFGR